ncbi:MAG: His/Gly/Thr/Pro-type tRNA ligase C-terminal domain-containing protein [Proteobacteria bacterium]|nr:His/Gly/Thr/Pro-type tRNA ligase C-terminal domain-containing protein [Pseudomonadota bacterium]
MDWSVDRLLAALEQLGAVESSQRQGVFIAMASVEARSYGFQLLHRLRKAGLLADIALKEGKLGNQFKFADKRQYQHVLTLGGDELASGTVSMKNLASGEERKGLSFAEALAELQG